MKKIVLVIIVLLLSVFLFGCTSVLKETPTQKEEQYKEEPQQASEPEKESVTNLVKNFGSKLQLVSLLAPEEELKKSMRENYGAYVSEELLAEWVIDPLSAPGRLTSSPWPDRIEILSAEKLSEHEYEVKGVIIEITSVEKEEGGIAAKRPVTIRVKKTDMHWRIDYMLLGNYEEVTQ